MLWKCRQIGGALWHYLNQPLYSEPRIAVWKPNRFWYLYKIELLEKCWRINRSSESRSNH